MRYNNNGYGESFMWKVFPFVFWPMFFGMLIVNLTIGYLTVFHPRYIGEWNAQLLAPIIEKIKE